MAGEISFFFFIELTYEFISHEDVSSFQLLSLDTKVKSFFSFMARWMLFPNIWRQIRAASKIKQEFYFYISADYVLKLDYMG